LILEKLDQVTFVQVKLDSNDHLIQIFICHLFHLIKKQMNQVKVKLVFSVFFTMFEFVNSNYIFLINNYGFFLNSITNNYKKMTYFSFDSFVFNQVKQMKNENLNQMII
jgi:hypothetical protein